MPQSFEQSGARSFRTSLLLTEKVLDCEFKEVNLLNKPPEFLKISPIGKVSVFVEEDGTVIWDSTLITEYLDATYPQPRFYPSNTRQRLECRKWEELADNLGDNVINLWVLDLTNNLAPTRYRTKLETSINRLLAVFEEQLAQSQYLLSNDTWTAADIAALCSVGYYSFRLNED